ncbi:hypothetical protein MC885_002330, partial [Smutsia gigantea]
TIQLEAQLVQLGSDVVATDQHLQDLQDAHDLGHKARDGLATVLVDDPFELVAHERRDVVHRRFGRGRRPTVLLHGPPPGLSRTLQTSATPKLAAVEGSAGPGPPPTAAGPRSAGPPARAHRAGRRRRHARRRRAAWRSGRRARVWAPGLPGACSRWEEEEVVARKARVRRPAAPPKLESELGAMEARVLPGEGAPLPSETVAPTAGAWEGRAAATPPGNFGGGEAR